MTIESFIESQVKEYTSELIADALERDQDAIELARDIVVQIKRGFISAMEEQGQRELACELLNETDI
jgi:hypothetical protein